MTRLIDAANAESRTAATRPAQDRPRIEIYQKTWCPYSRAALALLEEKGVPIENIDVTHDRTREREMVERSGRTSVPEIFVDGALIGGYDELAALDADGMLDALIGAGPAGLPPGIQKAA
ncbi:MAG: glutaredoxin domain-containing protein [Rhodospirillales bacterium]